MNALAKTGIALAIAAAALVAASSTVLYSHSAHAAPAAAADHSLAVESRAITGAVTAIEAEGSVDVIVRQGAAPSMTVRAEKRLMGNIVTVQDGSKLRIQTRGAFFNVRQPMQVEIVVPQLTRLSTHGSGDARATGFTGNEIEVNTHGSGDLALTGQFRNVRAAIDGSGDMTLEAGNSDLVEVRMNGSGDLNASGKTAVLRGEVNGSGDANVGRLVADSATFRLGGSGDAELNVRNAVELKLNGSGDAHVTGQPKTRAVARAGSGEVSWD